MQRPDAGELIGEKRETHDIDYSSITAPAQESEQYMAVSPFTDRRKPLAGDANSSPPRLSLWIHRAGRSRAALRSSVGLVWAAGIAGLGRQPRSWATLENAPGRLSACAPIWTPRRSPALQGASATAVHASRRGSDARLRLRWPIPRCCWRPPPIWRRPATFSGKIVHFVFFQPAVFEEEPSAARENGGGGVA
ncbi:hypothetical protein LNP74_29600 [Klebsiella pneumoniae subsp. pneumoniae]|nr:hypothetical protein [Klebsiella pneumoniae subsp. pneumoniae]